jgi:hypothetical protein
MSRVAPLALVLLLIVAFAPPHPILAQEEPVADEGAAVGAAGGEEAAAGAEGGEVAEGVKIEYEETQPTAAPTAAPTPPPKPPLFPSWWAAIPTLLLFAFFVGIFLYLIVARIQRPRHRVSPLKELVDEVTRGRG